MRRHVQVNFPLCESIGTMVPPPHLQSDHIAITTCRSNNNNNDSNISEQHHYIMSLGGFIGTTVQVACNRLNLSTSSALLASSSSPPSDSSNSSGGAAAIVNNGSKGDPVAAWTTAAPMTDGRYAAAHGIIDGVLYMAGNSVIYSVV